MHVPGLLTINYKENIVDTEHKRGVNRNIRATDEWSMGKLQLTGSQRKVFLDLMQYDLVREGSTPQRGINPGVHHKFRYSVPQPKCLPGKII